MTLDNWLLALHLLSAFALMGALTMFWIMMVALRSQDTPGPVTALDRLMKIANIAVGVGVVGTIVFGVWLAISIDDYSVWDGWVLAAIVLWAIGLETGRRAGALFEPVMKQAASLLETRAEGPSHELAAGLRNPTAWTMHTVSTAATVLVLVDMIWKPGA